MITILIITATRGKWWIWNALAATYLNTELEVLKAAAETWSSALRESTPRPRRHCTAGTQCMLPAIHYYIQLQFVLQQILCSLISNCAAKLFRAENKYSKGGKAATTKTAATAASVLPSLTRSQKTCIIPTECRLNTGCEQGDTNNKWGHLQQEHVALIDSCLQCLLAFLYKSVVAELASLLQLAKHATKTRCRVDDDCFYVLG